jgi:lipoprotein-anchoring transpeptidase ErfK/SrfK
MSANRTFSKFTAFFFFTLLFCLSQLGCQPPAQNGSNVPSNVGPANANLNTNATASNTTQSTSTNSGSNLQITMPVIDAMFAEENFADDAKKSLNLSDEELAKVREAARNSVLQLNGDPAGDENRSTRSSAENTRRELEELIGKQKAAELVAFVQNRWAGSGTEKLVSAPNSIPTDTRVVVNAPAYRMDIFKDGKLTKTYKVGIGYPEFPLPAGLRQAKEIIFNPSWTPPDEPWVKGKFAPGKKVEAGSKLNPLGPIKIPIGLPSLIHGGKNPSRIGPFASHGCVGLTDSMIQDFALELSAMSGTPMSASDIKEHLKEKDQTQNVKLASPVPVELRYETIVVEDGKVHVYRDVYELGTNTEENLRTVLTAFGVSFDDLPETDRSKLMDAISKMAVDAKGNAVDGDSGNSNKTSGKVTTTIKGEKEVVVEIPLLKGKGYPAPVALVQK